MKSKRKSSNIIDARDDLPKMIEEKKTDMLQKAIASPRTLVNEPVAWNNDKNSADRVAAYARNPGQKKGFKKPHRNADPAPQSFKKSGKNYENIPDFEFFKHTIKEN